MNSISTDYTGRTVDLSIFPTIAISMVPVGDSIDPSRAIAGPSKLAQNFLRILMTPLGTYASNVDFGSNFMLRLKNGSIKFPVDLSQAFSAEALRVQLQMQKMYAANTPDDEKLGTISLQNFTINRGVVQLTINLTTVAGSSASFLLPVVWNN